MTATLETERKYFAAQAATWAKTYAGRFLVVKGQQLIGDFATIEEALAAGASRFGLESFLVRRAGEKEETVSIPALTLGLISAHP